MCNSGAGITHQLPQIMGLDGAGVVEELDASETQLSVGQHVVIHPGVSCGRCEFCQRGEGVLGTQMQYLGEHRDGAFAEWISVPVRNVFAMPHGLTFAQAAALGGPPHPPPASRMLLRPSRSLSFIARGEPLSSMSVFGTPGPENFQCPGKPVEKEADR